jgi:hypothetical protein
VREQRAALDAEPGQQRGDAARLAGKAEIGRVAPAAVAEPRQIEDEAGVVRRERGQQCAPGVAVHGEAVDQHDRRSAAEAPNREGRVADLVAFRCGGRVERFGCHRHGS